VNRELLIALGLVALVGCGSGAPASQPAAAPEVVVPEQTDTDEPDPENGSAETPAPRAASGDDVESCARGLRDGEGVRNRDGESVYGTALSAERAGDMTQARKSYFELVQNSPRSGFMPLAYLAFGELFRKEAESDPSKLMLAQQSYQEVIKYPPPDNTSYAYAMLRLGDVQVKGDDKQNALNSYKKAIEAGAQYAQLPCAVAVASAAKKKMVVVYADVGAPNKAYVFFKTIAGEKDALEMVADLAEVYRDLKKPKDGCEATRSASSSRLSQLQQELCGKP
jgi:TolA-binding protein